MNIKTKDLQIADSQMQENKGETYGKLEGAG
jgi:hypothetical protein